MGFVYSEVRLVNAGDREMARRCMLDEADIRHINISVLVDSGAWMLTINRNIQDVLQLPFERKEGGQTADGRWIECDVVGPVRVEWQNRSCHCDAMVTAGRQRTFIGRHSDGRNGSGGAAKRRKIGGETSSRLPRV